MPSPKSDPEVVEANADLAAAHLETAAESAARAERELAEANKANPNSRLCPHDNAEMSKHGEGNPAKAGAWHCSKCGCCFKGREVREGHPACAQVTATP